MTSKAPKELVLMTTEGCHLCEQAVDLWHQLASESSDLSDKFAMKTQEITDSTHLFERYGLTIPVFVCDSRELGWPFDVDILKRWLLNLKTSVGREKDL